MAAVVPPNQTFGKGGGADINVTVRICEVWWCLLVCVDVGEDEAAVCSGGQGPAGRGDRCESHFWSGFKA